jgi:hypothetical protein
MAGMRTARRRLPFQKPPAPSREFPRTHVTDVARVVGRRNLTASATPINLTDRKQLQEQRVLRAGWQYEAWAYRRSIPEARFATNFLANCAKRMRVFAAAYPATGETDGPVPLDQIKDIPPNVALAANSAIRALGNGRQALGGLLHKLSNQVSVPGECWLVGQSDPLTGSEKWKVRSVSEIIIKDDRYTLRQVPQDSQGAITWIDLDPDETVLTRLWVPDPEWDIMADSPMRTLGETCEGLQILRRGIRASGRSRLSGAGVFVMPSEMEIKRPNDDNDDPEADDFVGDLMDAMATAIADEGTASADIPIFLQGPGEFLEKIRLISFATGYDKEALQALDYLQSLFAVGFDLPKIVVTGQVEEANHWSAWSVSADTFRHYIEPHVMTCVDLLTAGYLRQALIADGVPMEWVERLLVWYDPVELIAAPDKSAAAGNLHAAFTISDEAYRRESGFTEQDAPTIEELERRRVQDIRALPLNLLMEYARRADPSLIVPPINVAGTVPGIKAGGVDLGTPLIAPTPPESATAETAPPPPEPSSVAPVPGPPPAPTDPDKTPPGITASAVSAPRKPTAREIRLSRKLSQIDADVRARLRVAANLAMKTRLERAGKRVKDAAHGRGAGALGKNPEAITLVAGKPDWLAAAALGQKRVQQLGLTTETLTSSDWPTFKAQFKAWTAEAAAAAIVVATQLAGDVPQQTIDDTKQTLAANTDEAWVALAAGMTALASKLLYNPDPDDLAEKLATVNLDTLVPTGLIRTALGSAGALAAPAEAAPTMVAGQLATGSTIGNLLTIGGAVMHSYTWEHGSPQNEFEPHSELDGVAFDSFTDQSLQNTGDFPPVQYFLPGDHDGCTCDVTPNWMSGGDDSEDS